MDFEMILHVWEKIPAYYSFNGKEWPVISLDVKDIVVQFDIFDVFDQFDQENSPALFENTISARANRIREEMMKDNPNLIHISIKSINRINE